MPETRRLKTKQFWLSLNIEGINRNTYRQHEYFLFKMIFHNYEDKLHPSKHSMQEHGIAIPRDPLADNMLFTKIFKNGGINKDKWIAFFNNRTMQILWNSFKESEQMTAFIDDIKDKNLCQQHKETFKEHFQELSDEI